MAWDAYSATIELLISLGIIIYRIEKILITPYTSKVKYSIYKYIFSMWNIFGRLSDRSIIEFHQNLASTLDQIFNIFPARDVP